jgi:BolA family transcriptional regulator, general stress-responsive regulator
MSIQTQLYDKLTEHFQPRHLAVINESHQHNVPPGSESHFKVVLVADQFADMRLLDRHRQVNHVLQAELTQIHALALHVYTIAEWEQTQATAPSSPTCRGGAKREAEDR